VLQVVLSVPAAFADSRLSPGDNKSGLNLNAT
jgi:hypothetical protein